VPIFQITYAESVGGQLSESVEADQFEDTGEFIDFLATGDTAGEGTAVQQVLRVRSQHVDRIELVDASDPS
jgi:hypothetical protein